MIGLPEVKLGLIPGWAGTIRVARIAGIEPQLDLVTSGRLVRADEALALGIVDQVTKQDQLMDSAVNLIEQNFEHSKYLERRSDISQEPHPSSMFDSDSMRTEFTRRIDANRQEIHTTAPTVGLDHMLRALKLSEEDAYHSEAVAFAELWGCPSCKGLLNHFFLGEHGRRQPGKITLEPPTCQANKVGIVGAGVMGHSIAAANLARRKSIKIMDVDSRFSKNVVEGLQDQGDIQLAESLAELNDCDLIIECVTEDLATKQRVLQQIEAAVTPDTLIATNTSAIRISSLASALEHPERFCGIHFCHPELMSLVEVVAGSATSADTLSNAVAYVRSLGKTALCPADRPGFVVNRMLASMIAGAIRQLTHGQTIDQIDSSMREFGFQGGPFEIMDVIGIDICLHAGQSMFKDGIQSMTASPILPRMVKVGRRGRKSLKGFYRYLEPRGERMHDPDIADLMEPYVQSDQFRTLSSEETVSHILATMVLEAAQLVEDLVVADYRDVDIAVIHGFGFPAHQGGILFWADQFGIQKIGQTLVSLSALEPSLRPSGLLKELVDRQGTFYR